MKIDKWAVVLVSESTRKTRQFKVPGLAVRHSTRIALALGGLLMAVLVFAAIRGGNALHFASLRQENRILTEELNRMRATVSQIGGEIDDLAEKDRRNRMLAGLIEIDPEVFAVGIGGPGMENPSETPLWQHDPGASAAVHAINYDLATLARKADLLESSFAETEASFENRHDRMRAMPTLLPAFGPISSHYSHHRRHPVYGDFRPHPGVDQSGSIGAPFVATADGRVTFSGWKPGYGYTIQIDHGAGFSTLYGHASRLLVSAGDVVQRAQTIGEIGCTGVCTGPHVHYEIWVDGEPVNPLDYVLLPIGL